MDETNPRAITRAERPLTVADLRISESLWRVLSSTLPADVEVAAIVADPVLHAEAKLISADLSALAAGCGREVALQALQPAVLVYGRMEAMKTSAFWDRYARQLADLPAEAIRLALDDYDALPTSEFFPKPGPLRALALKRAEPILRAAGRAKRAAMRIPPRVIDKGTNEERAALIASALPKSSDDGPKFSGDAFRAAGDQSAGG